MSTSVNRYPWYETIQGNGLEEGDILRRFPVLVADSGLHGDIDQLQGEIRTFDVVILPLATTIRSCAFALDPRPSVAGGRKLGPPWDRSECRLC